MVASASGTLAAASAVLPALGAVHNVRRPDNNGLKVNGANP
jgi:hypothetical protein